MKNTILKTNEQTLKIDISTPAFPDSALLIGVDDWQELQTLTKGARVAAIRQGGKGDSRAPVIASVYLDGKRVPLHRLLLPDSEAVGFRNSDRLDLTRANLYPSTKQANRTRSAHRDSQTGERFISPSGDGYRLDYRHAGKTYYIGVFSCVDKAADVREAIECELRLVNKQGAEAMFSSLKA